jgi:hypothetical protein
MIGRVWPCRVAKIAAGKGRIYLSLCPKWQNSDIGPSQLDVHFRADTVAKVVFAPTQTFRAVRATDRKII